MPCAGEVRIGRGEQGFECETTVPTATVYASGRAVAWEHRSSEVLPGIAMRRASGTRWAPLAISRHRGADHGRDRWGAVRVVQPRRWRRGRAHRDRDLTHRRLTGRSPAVRRLPGRASSDRGLGRRDPGEPAAASDRQDGSSPVTAVVGLLVFLGFLLLSSQALVHLYATSVVTAVAFDAARLLAAEPDGCAGGDVDAMVGERLAGLARAGAVQATCRDDAERRTVTIVARSPARALAGASGPAGPSTIERSASVTIERLR